MTGAFFLYGGTSTSEGKAKSCLADGRVVSLSLAAWSREQLDQGGGRFARTRTGLFGRDDHDLVELRLVGRQFGLAGGVAV